MRMLIRLARCEKGRYESMYLVYAVKMPQIVGFLPTMCLNINISLI